MNLLRGNKIDTRVEINQLLATEKKVVEALQFIIKQLEEPEIRKILMQDRAAWQVLWDHTVAVDVVMKLLLRSIAKGK